jgi:hypothetical protein
MIWFFLIGLSFLTLPLIDFFHRFAYHPISWIRNYGQKNLLHCFVFLLPWFSIISFTKLSHNIRSLLAFVLVTLLAVDLYIIQSNYNPFIDPNVIYNEPTPLSYVKQQSPHVRMLSNGSLIGSNMSTAYGVDDPRIYDTITIAWYGEYLNYLHGGNKELDSPALGYVKFLGGGDRWLNNPNFRFASLASIRYFWVPKNRSLDFDRIKICFSDDVSNIYENLESLPRAYIASTWSIVKNYKDALAVLSKENFPWRKKIVIEGDTNSLSEIATPSINKEFQSAKILIDTPHRIKVELPEDSHGILVLNDCFYPGWTAFVDGQPTKIYRVNGTFRGVFINSNNKKVYFQYRPLTFRVGAILSILSFFVICLLIVSWRNGSTRKRIN